MTPGSVIKFRTPPVVEVWISIDFDPNENKREWELELVKQYVEKYEVELPKVEAVHQQQIQVQETSSQALPKVVGRQYEERSRVLQIGDDQLSFHVLKTDDAYPGYHVVRTELENKLEVYEQVFQPTRIRNATLHYLEVIDIPRPESGKIELGDYFRASIDLPEEPFGPTAGFAHQFQVMCPVDLGPLFVQLQAIPSPPDSNVFRFRMEWHKQSSNVNTLDSTQVWTRMDIAHEYMRKCFRAALTERTIELFQPVREND